MLKLGTIDGISLSFDDSGSLSAIHIARHGRTLALSEDLPAPIARTDRPGPVFARGEFPQGKAFALESHGRHLAQTLPGGRRGWDVYQSRADAREASLAWACATVVLEAPMEWRLTVNDCVASVQQATGEQSGDAPAPTQISVQCSPSLALRITAPAGASYQTTTAKGEITGVTVTVPLPAGESQVELVVESRPPYDVADTLILCMPHQLGEAAVVATCVRGKPANQGKYVPVLDVMNPPMSPEEYREASEGLQTTAQEFQKAQEELLSRANPAAAAASPGLILPGGGPVRSEDKSKELLMRRQELQKKLADQQAKLLSFAGWQRRWERVLRLVNEFRPAHVVMLYPVPPELAAAISPGADRTFFFFEDFRAEIGEWDKALAERLGGEAPEIVYFTDLEMLSRLAWERLSGRAFEGAFTIPDDPRYYPLGVRRALQTGKPLLPKGRAGQKVNLEAATEQANQGATSAETIIVEADGTLASLAAALYADLLNAPLLVHPAANPQDVVIKIGNIQASVEKEELARQSAAAYAYIGEHKGKFLQDPKATQQMRTLVAGIQVIELPRSMPTPYSAEVFMQMASTYLNTKEQGVESSYRYEKDQWEKDALDLTAVVTARIDGMVRAKMLKRQRATAFTVGVPYNFVDGWRDKTVTHVMTEPCLTVLRAVLSRALRPPAAAFAVVFDSGILRPVEPPQVTRRLRHGRTYPLYLRDAAANSGALQTYPALLPVESILLDTLGDESGLFFVDQRRGFKPFTAPEIGLTLDLAHQPLVFTHIAFSWLAVGAAFLSAGARAYMGTLWSVESDPALEMALRTLGTTPAETDSWAAFASDGVPVDEMTRRAYIRLGLPEMAAPAPVSMAEEGALPHAAARQALFSAMTFLAEAGLHEHADPLFRSWEALCDQDLAAAGDDAGLLKDEMDAEERFYHRMDQAGREKRATGEAQALAAEGAAGLGAEPGFPSPESPAKPAEKPRIFLS